MSLFSIIFLYFLSAAQGTVTCNKGYVCNKSSTKTVIVDHVNYVLSAPDNACSFHPLTINKVPYKDQLYDIPKLPTKINVIYSTCAPTTATTTTPTPTPAAPTPSNTTFTFVVIQMQYGLCVNCGGFTPVVGHPYCQKLLIDGAEVSTVGINSSLDDLGKAYNAVVQEKAKKLCASSSVQNISQTYSGTPGGACGAAGSPGIATVTVTVTCSGK